MIQFLCIISGVGLFSSLVAYLMDYLSFNAVVMCFICFFSLVYFA